MRTLGQGLLLAALLLPLSQRLAAQPGDQPQVVSEQGHPALLYSGRYRCYEVGYSDHGGTPAFKFYGGTAGPTFGFLYVAQNRIAFEPENPKYEKHAFDVLRAELIQARTDTAEVAFVLPQGRYYFSLWHMGAGQGYDEENCKAASSAGSDSSAEAATRRWLALAVSDFGAAEQEFKRLTASLLPNPPPQVAAAPAQVEPAKPPPPPPPKLVLSTQPGNVGVYVDDEFKGISSGEGRLVVSNLEPGDHHLRFTLIGYKELTQSLDLAAGETRTVEAKLEPAGPKPLALAEIEEALTNGVPKVRVMALVNQFGVDFSLNEEAEQRLRKAGADSDLLLLITKSKK